MQKTVTASLTTLLLACVVSAVLPAQAVSQSAVSSMMAIVTRPIVLKVNEAAKGPGVQISGTMVKFQFAQDSTPAAIVIDGERVPALDSKMDASDIEKIEVLTDPASQKKYGAQSVISLTSKSTK